MVLENDPDANTERDPIPVVLRDKQDTMPFWRFGDSAEERPPLAFSFWRKREEAN